MRLLLDRQHRIGLVVALALGAALPGGLLCAFAKAPNAGAKVDKIDKTIKKVKPPKSKGVEADSPATPLSAPASSPVRPPVKPADPSPAPGGTGIDVHGGLQWSPASGAASYDVYFGPRDPPPFKSRMTKTTFETGELEPGAAYFWRIDAVNALGAARGEVWSFTTRKPGDPYDPRLEYSALDGNAKTDQKQQAWGETLPPLKGKQLVRFGPGDVVSYDFDGCNMNMPYHVGGRYAQELGRLNGAFDIPMGYLYGDESGVWSRPYKMLDGVSIDVDEKGQPRWTLNDCRKTVNRFSHLEFEFEKNGLRVVRRDLPSDIDCAMYYLIDVANTGAAPRAVTLRFAFEENIRPGWIDRWDLRMGPDVIELRDGRFAAFDSYRGHLAIAFGGASSADRAETDSTDPYRKKGILQYDLSLEPGQTVSRDFLCVQYDTVKRGPADSPVDAALASFDRLKGAGRPQLADKDAAWVDDLYSQSPKLVCPDPMLTNGFYGAKFGLRVMRVDVRDYHPYPCQFVCDTNYMSLFGIDNLYSFSGGVAAGLWQVARATLRDINYFGQLHPNSLIYKNVCADPHTLPPTGDGRAQESTMFVGQVWDYARWTGDREFLEEMYGPCASYTRLTEAMDRNGDLLPEGMCQPNAGKGFEDQNIDGASYLWWALRSMANMARVLDKPADAATWQAKADRLKKTINEAFWNEKAGVWAAWIDLDQKQYLLFDPTAGQSHASILAPMRLGLADGDKGRLCLDTLERHCVDATGFHGPATTSWSTGMMAMGAYRYGLPDLGRSLVEICARRAFEDDMFIPSHSNVMGGIPDASRKINYVWSCGPPLEAIIRGMFGIEPNAFDRTVDFVPQIPREWTACSLRTVRVGAHTLDFEYKAPFWTITHVSGPAPMAVAWKASPGGPVLERSEIAPGANHVFRAMRIADAAPSPWP